MEMNEEEVHKEELITEYSFRGVFFLSLSYPVSQFSGVHQHCSRGLSISGHGSPCREQIQLLESDEVVVRIV